MVKYKKNIDFCIAMIFSQFITGNNKTYWSLCTVAVTALKQKNVRLLMTFFRRGYNFAKQILRTEKTLRKF